MAKAPDTIELPAQAAAKAELATKMFPAPEDCLNDVDAITALFYGEQWLEALLCRWIVESIDVEHEDPDVQAQVAQVMDAIGAAGGNLVAACAIMGLVPGEATER